MGKYKRLGKCKRCGSSIWSEKVLLCGQCFYLYGEERFFYCIGGHLPDSFEETQDEFVDRYMTTPQRNIHKMDWDD